MKFEEFLEQINNLSFQSEILSEPGIEKEFKAFSQTIKISKSVLDLFQEEFQNIRNHPYDEEYIKNLNVKTIITKLWKNGKTIKIIY